VSASLEDTLSKVVSASDSPEKNLSKVVSPGCGRGKACEFSGPGINALHRFLNPQMVPQAP
jgi:hypothetical protein